MNFIYLTINYAVHTICISVIIQSFQNKCYKIINQLVVETLKGNNITQEGIYVCIILSQIILKSMISILNIALIYISSLYCAFSNKKILNIDRYVVCESRNMSDESGTYIILLKLKTILFTWR